MTTTPPSHPRVNPHFLSWPDYAKQVVDKALSASKQANDLTHRTTMYDVVVEPGAEGFSREECQSFFRVQDSS